MRPILDRMDYALTQLLQGYEVSEASGFEVQLPRAATYQEWVAEFRDASAGARPPIELTGIDGVGLHQMLLNVYVRYLVSCAVYSVQPASILLGSPFPTIDQSTLPVETMLHSELLQHMHHTMMTATAV